MLCFMGKALAGNAKCHGLGFYSTRMKDEQFASFQSYCFFAINGVEGIVY